jgi:hypothetical protein
LQVLGFLDAEHILMHLHFFVKFHAGEGRKITTLHTFESFSISNFRSRNSSQKGAIPCQNRQKDENGTFNTLFNLKFPFKKQTPKRPQYFC